MFTDNILLTLNEEEMAEWRAHAREVNSIMCKVLTTEELQAAASRDRLREEISSSYQQSWPGDWILHSAQTITDSFNFEEFDVFSNALDYDSIEDVDLDILEDLEYARAVSPWMLKPGLADFHTSVDFNSLEEGLLKLKALMTNFVNVFGQTQVDDINYTYEGDDTYRLSFTALITEDYFLKGF